MNYLADNLEVTSDITQQEEAELLDRLDAFSPISIQQEVESFMGDYVVEQVTYTVTENYGQQGGHVAGDGYTKWASGKLEQWGHSDFSASNGATSSQAYFHVPFINTNYRFFASMNYNASVVGNVVECYWSTGAQDRRDVRTLISWMKDGHNYAGACDWYVVGRWK